MKPLKIVIVTYNWPPRNAIGTHRPYAWAKRWSELGASVTVLTAQKHPYDAPLDLDLPPLPGVGIEEVAYGSTVAKLGGGMLRDGPTRQFAKTLVGWFRSRFGVNADIREKWQAAARQRALQLSEKSDIVVSTYGPAASHLIAFEMKQHNPALFWVADYRDLWSQRHTVELTERHRARERQLEVSSVGEGADLLTAVSHDMVEQLDKLTGKPVLLVRNGFDIEEDMLRKRLKMKASRFSAPLRLVHTGTLYEGLRDPEPLLAALAALLNEGKIAEGEISVDFYGARIDPARRLAKNPQYAPFIRLMGHVPRAEALKAQQQADLLLLLESPDPRARGVLTGKVFEYIASGTPVLSLGSLADYEIPKLLSETGTGISFSYDNTVALKQFLVQCLDGVSQATAYRPDLSKIMHYSRHRQADELYTELRQRLRQHR